MINLNKIKYIYFFKGYTDLRKSIHGLSALIRNLVPMEELQNTLFVFCSKDRMNIKMIVLDYDGWWLFQKKLFNSKFLWPKFIEELKSITKRQLEWFLDGLNINQKYAHEEYKPVAYI